MTKQTGIVDRFEGDSVVVEVNSEMVNFDRADHQLQCWCEGMVVIIRTTVSLISTRSRPSAWKTICAVDLSQILSKNTD